jgi:hypothetical protein
VTPVERGRTYLWKPLRSLVIRGSLRPAAVCRSLYKMHQAALHVSVPVF